MPFWNRIRPVPPRAPDEVIWAMSFTCDRDTVSTGISETKNEWRTAGGDPLAYRVYMRMGVNKIYPKQSNVTRAEAIELALKYAEALEYTYAAGARHQ